MTKGHNCSILRMATCKLNILSETQFRIKPMRSNRSLSLFTGSTCNLSLSLGSDSLGAKTPGVNCQQISGLRERIIIIVQGVADTSRATRGKHLLLVKSQNTRLTAVSYRLYLYRVYV